MVNKKVILGILTIGMLATVAGAGTWAYYQDTITSTNSVDTAAFGFTVNGQATTNGIASFTGLSAANALPGDEDLQVATYPVVNTGDVVGDVYAKIVTPTGFNTNIAIEVDDITMTDTPQLIKSDLGITGETNSFDSEITYTYTNTDENQYAEEDASNSFEIVYYFVPADEEVTEVAEE